MIWIILLLALVLRIINLNQSFWLDEAIGTIAVNEFSYTGLVTEFAKFDNHPPIYYLLLKTWGGVFGYTEIAIRFLSVLFGVSTVALVYMVAQEISISDRKHRERWALLSAVFVATAPLHIYYSQEARMYPVAAFLATLAVWLFVRILRKSMFLDWLAWSLVITALAFTDYVPIFLFPVFWIVPVFLRKNKRWFLKLAAWHVPLTTVFFLWLPVFFIQSQKGQWLLSTLPAWRDIAGRATVKQAALVWIKFTIGRISFSNKTIYSTVVGVASLPLLFGLFVSFFRRRKSHILLWAWLTIPLLAGFMFSFFIPAFTYVRFLYVLPAFYLLLAWAVVSFPRSGKILAFAIIFINLFGWFVYFSNQRFWREDWRGATSFVESKIKGNEIVLFEFPDPFAPYRWYSENGGMAFGALTSISAEEGKTQEHIENLVEGKNAVWYFHYLRELSDPNRYVDSNLADLGFRSGKIYDFRGVGLVEYWKKQVGD